MSWWREKLHSVWITNRMIMFPRRAIRQTAREGKAIQMCMSSSPGIPNERRKGWSCVLLGCSISGWSGYRYIFCSFLLPGRDHNLFQSMSTPVFWRSLIFIIQLRNLEMDYEAELKDILTSEVFTASPTQKNRWNISPKKPFALVYFILFKGRNCIWL